MYKLSAREAYELLNIDDLEIELIGVDLRQYNAGSSGIEACQYIKRKEHYLDVAIIAKE